MRILISATALLVSILIASCGNNSNEESNSNAAEQVEPASYECPMKCEGDKMYAEKGTCPVCKMDLELAYKEAKLRI
ncbi:hypothetical protein RCC89_00365 [Cytophagaceae bacterium ABcell3]|nr:hypothetical protein RCC89_00365 [Cytophagaceae bacterium ABcell3]